MSFVSAHRFGASLEVPDTFGFRLFAFLEVLLARRIICVGPRRSSFWRPVARMGSSLSVLGNVFWGSSVSFRSFARLGASLSALEVRPWVLFVIVGFSRVGDSLSLFGSARYGSSLALGHTPGFVSIASLWSTIGRVAFRLIFLPDRVLDGIAEPLPRREISLGSNLLPRDLRIVTVLEIDFSILGASVSFRNFHGFGASLGFRRLMSGILGGFEVCALVNSNGLWLMDLFNLAWKGSGI